jgi:hypothetical protein
MPGGHRSRTICCVALFLFLNEEKEISSLIKTFNLCNQLHHAFEIRSSAEALLKWWVSDLHALFETDIAYQYIELFSNHITTS